VTLAPNFDSAYARRNPLALSVVTIENTAKCRLSFSMEQLRQGDAKNYADVSSLSDALDREAHLVLIALAFSHEMLASFSRKARAVATKSLVPINAQVSKTVVHSRMVGCSEVIPKRRSKLGKC